MRLSDVLSKPLTDEFIQVEGFLNEKKIAIGKQKKISIGKVGLTFFCKNCEDSLTFISSNELFCIGVNNQSLSIDCVLTCTRCNKTTVPSWFLVISDGDISARDPRVRIQKRNHKLSQMVTQSKEQFGIFTDFLEKAHHAHSEGLGAGSLVYLRKILETITVQAATASGIMIQTPKGKRKNFKELLQEVDRKCSIIPKDFSQNGYKLFGELSDVLHATYDEEIGLQKYTPLRRLVVGVIQNVEQSKELNEAINSLGWTIEGEVT